MKTEYTKSKENTSTGSVWSICEYYSFDDEPKAERNHKVGEMSIMRGGYKISGGPVIAWFPFESHADEYIKFKTEQLIDKK